MSRLQTLVLRNRQKTVALNSRFLRRLAVEILEKELALPTYELGFQLVTPESMARINGDFLQHEGSTDVITFDYREEAEPMAAPGAIAKPGPRAIHGEIFISLEDAVKQAREFRTTWPSELVRYVIHGILHLLGYDDLTVGARRIMKREENRLLQRISRRFDLDELALTPARRGRA